MKSYKRKLKLKQKYADLFMILLIAGIMIVSITTFIKLIPEI